MHSVLPDRRVKAAGPSTGGQLVRRRTAIAAVAVGLVVAVSGCQPSDEPTPDGSATPAASPSSTPSETAVPTRAPVSAVVDTIEVGSGPGLTTIAPDGSAAFVSNASDGTVSVLDLATNEVTNTIEVGERPAGSVLHDGLLFVADVGDAPYGPPTQLPGLVVVDVAAGDGETATAGPPAQATAEKTWSVTVSITEQGDDTTATAVLGVEAPESLDAEGRSHRNPHDPASPTIGDEVAVARALRRLADRLLEKAESNISISTGVPADIEG